MEILGIDIGGSGIKAALVDPATGELTSERLRTETPQPGAPGPMIEALGKLVDQFGWDGPIGCGFPGVVRNGTIFTAANLDPSWIGTDLRAELSTETACPVTALNDADAAGLAEVRFGAGRGRRGVILMLTIGTGIGSSLFVDGRLVPNTELGHVEIDGKTIEARASDRTRESKELSWKKWAERLDEAIARLGLYVGPDLVILGGGVSKKHDKFIGFPENHPEIVPAVLRNQAGIVGAAMAAQEYSQG